MFLFAKILSSSFSIGDCVAYSRSDSLHGKKTLLWPVSGRTCFRIAFHIMCTVNAHYFNFFVPLAQDSREQRTYFELVGGIDIGAKKKIAAAIKLQKAAIDQTAAYITLTGMSGCHMFDARERKTPSSRSELTQSDRFFFLLSCTSAVMSFLQSLSVVFGQTLFISNLIDTQPLRWLGLENFRSFSTHIECMFMQNIFAVRSPATDLERRVRPQCSACSWHACATQELIEQ